MSYYLLKQEDFPRNEFFTYLEKGVECYQRGQFQRAIWEWFSASRFNSIEPVNIKHTEQTVNIQCQLQNISLLFFFYVIYLNNLSGIGQLQHSNTTQQIIFKDGHICFLENIKKKNV